MSQSKVQRSYIARSIQLFCCLALTLNSMTLQAAEPGRYGSQRPVSYPNSNYPAVPDADKRPLPNNRSLVIIDGEEGARRSHSPRGSGQAEISNTYTDRYLKTDPYRPSMLQRLDGFNQNTQAWVADQIQRLRSGQPNDLVGNGQSSTKNPISNVDGASKARPIANMTKTAGLFYIVLGLAAAVALYSDYPNNPAAWTSFIDSSTDPVGIAQLITFLAVAGGVYWAGQKAIRSRYGEAALDTKKAKTFLYAGSMISAVLVGTVVSEFMADPNFKQCNGFNSYKATGKFERDSAACDKLYDTWTSNARWNKLAAEQILPMLANIMVAGGLIQALNMGARYLFSRQFMLGTAASIQRINLSISAKGGPVVAFGRMVLQFGLWYGAYQISDKVFGVGQGVREYFATEWSFSTDPLGKSLNQVERNLFDEWSRLKESDFKLYQTADGKVTAPKPYNINELLDKYQSSLQGWRQLQLSDTQGAYNQWRLKSDRFHAMIDISEAFYLRAADKIAYERSETNPELLAKFGFNKQFVDAFVADQNAKKTPAWELVKDEWSSSTWKYVLNRSMGEYLITSMACGPEGEGYKDSRTGILARVSDFWTNWISGNSNPDAVIDDKKGLAISFNPPRLVRPIDGKGTSVCQTNSTPGPIPFTSSSGPTPPSHFVVETGRKRYDNLYTYIRDEIRPGILENKVSHFSNWWRAVITPQVEEHEKLLRADYEKLLNNEYKNALLNKTYRSCGPGPVSLPDVERYLRGLPSANDFCPSEATHRLAYGLINSLRDEMRLYMALLMDLDASNEKRLGPLKAEKGKTLLANSKRLLDVFDEIAAATTETSKDQRADQEPLLKEAAELIRTQQLTILSDPSVGADSEDAKSGKNPEAAVAAFVDTTGFMLGNRIQGIFPQLIALHNMLVLFEK